MYTIFVSQTTSFLPKMVRRMWDLEDYQDALFYARSLRRHFRFVRLVGPNTNELFQQPERTTDVDETEKPHDELI